MPLKLTSRRKLSSPAARFTQLSLEFGYSDIAVRDFSPPSNYRVAGGKACVSPNSSCLG